MWPKQSTELSPLRRFVFHEFGEVEHLLMRPKHAIHHDDSVVRIVKEWLTHFSVLVKTRHCMETRERVPAVRLVVWSHVLRNFSGDLTDEREFPTVCKSDNLSDPKLV